MSGSASPQTQTQNTNTTSTAGPNPYIQPELQDLVGQLTSWRQANPNAPAYYPGGTVAPRSPADLSARDATWQTASNGLNALGGQFAPAIGYLSDAASGKYLDAGNPYMASKLEAAFRPQAEQFTNLVAPSLQSTFGSAGRPGGGLEWANLQQQFKTGLAQTQSDAAAKSAADVYGMERGLQSGAATALPGVLGQYGGQAANWLSMLQGVGAGDTAYDQRLLGDANARYDYTNRAQPDFLTGLAQRYLSMYPGGTTSGTGTSTGMMTPAGGGFGSIAGPALGLAGLGMQAFSAFSDERLKDVHARVGFTDDGLPLYLYHYKGTKEPRIGPMAQEVARVKPDAVAAHPSGFLTVDYRKAMPTGGLM